MGNYRMWAHGTAVIPEWAGDNLLRVRGATWDSGAEYRDVPASEMRGLPRGWGTTFRGKRAFTTGIGGSSTTGPFDPGNPFAFSQKGYWFHFPIPTPAYINDVMSRLTRVFLRWEAGPGVTVWAIHIYDGLTRIEAMAAPDHAGSTGVFTDVFTLPAGRPVNWSVGVSVAVAFARDGDITFFGAAGDFEV